MLLGLIILRWILVGKLKEGTFDVMSWMGCKFFFAFSLGMKISFDIVPLKGTPFAPLFVNILGGNMSTDCLVFDTVAILYEPGSLFQDLSLKIQNW